eukprot:CFRG0392T1
MLGEEQSAYGQNSPDLDQNKNVRASSFLKSDEDQYWLVKEIGSGTYGDVFQARVIKPANSHLLDSEEGYEQLEKRKNEFCLVAMKRIKLVNGTGGIPSSALREMGLLKELKHPSIVKLLRVVYQSNKLFLVFELAREDLHHFIQRKKKVGGIKELQAKQMAMSILSAIKYAHSHCVMHRDLKPSNILVMPDETIKIGDWGLARTFGIPLRTFTNEVVTMWYRAPEIILGSTYTPAVDMWSFACIFVELFAGEVLFSGSSEISSLFRIFRVLGTPTERTFPGLSASLGYQKQFPKWKRADVIHSALNTTANDLARKMLLYDCEKRVTASEALEHSYFAE